MRPSPQFESTCACARFSICHFPTASLSCTAFFRGRRLRTGCLRAWGRAIPSERPSERERQEHFVWQRATCPKHRPHRQAVVRRDRADVRTGQEKAGSGGAVEGEFRRREAERCAQVRNFCRKAPRFSSFHGDFCDKVRTFFLSVALFRAINRGEAPINGGENEPESARMYIRGVKNWWFHPFLVNLPQEIPAPHSHFSLVCGRLQSTP